MGILHFGFIETDDFDGGDRFFGSDLLFYLQEPDDVRDGVVEISPFADLFIGSFFAPVERKRKTVQSHLDDLPGKLFRQERPIGVKTGVQTPFFGIRDGLDDLRVKEGFTPVSQVDVEDVRSGLVHDFSVQIHIHIALVLFFQVLVRAHDTPVVAKAGQLYPEAYRPIGKLRGSSAVVIEKPDEAQPIRKRIHADFFMPSFIERLMISSYGIHVNSRRC
jgi:hypothetical protein